MKRVHSYQNGQDMSKERGVRSKKTKGGAMIMIRTNRQQHKQQNQ